MSNGPASLQLLSGVGIKGPACFVVEADGKRLILDLGEGPPTGLLPNVDDLPRVDAVVISHGHKDHIGGLSLLEKLGNPPVYATDAVARGLPTSATVRPLPIGGRTDILGVAVETGRNGHAPGGIWLHFAIGGGLLYTGDYCVESALYAYDPPSTAAATVLADCSYGGYQRPIAECWNDLAPLVAHGPLLLPVPANGRGPEIALEMMRHGHRFVFVDDAMQAALRRLCNSDGVSLRDGIGGEVARLAAAARPIGEANGVMLAASADGTSGATVRLLREWKDAAEPAIVFTGYVPAGTPADRLIRSGRAQGMRWNVHPRLSDTVALARAVQARTLIAAFCDRSQLAPLSAALAPVNVTVDGPVTL